MDKQIIDMLSKVLANQEAIIETLEEIKESHAELSEKVDNVSTPGSDYGYEGS